MSYVAELLTTLQESEPVTWRAAGAEFFSQQPLLVGYAVVWNTLSSDRGGYRLRYDRTAFWQDIFRQTAIDIWIDHDARRPVGRTFIVDADAYGLWIEAFADGSESSRLLWSAVSTAALPHFSIGATTIHGTHGIVDAERGRLHEVSLTTTPAMPHTVARLRHRWPNTDRLRDLLIIDNASVAAVSDSQWLTFQAAKAVLRHCELFGETIPKSLSALRRQASLLSLDVAA